MNWKTLNRIKKSFGSPINGFFNICNFFMFPVHLIFGFCATDFEDEWDRNFYFEMLKKSISFGFWK